MDDPVPGVFRTGIDDDGIGRGARTRGSVECSGTAVAAVCRPRSTGRGSSPLETPVRLWTFTAGARKIVRLGTPVAHRLLDTEPGESRMRNSKLTLALALCAFAAAPAAAQELTGTLKKIKDSGTITIG